MHPDFHTAFGGRYVARTSELLAAGAGQHDIRLAVGEARIIRVRKGVYALPEADPARLAAAAHCGAPCCVSAARLMGLWVLDDGEAAHVGIGLRARRHSHPECRCRIHRVAGASVGVDAGIVEILRQLYYCQGEEGFFVTLESALRLGLLSLRMRERLRRGLPAAARWLVDFARSDADSGIESLLRLRLHPHGIGLAAQVRIPGMSPVDFVLGDRLILELDGRENHDGPSKRHKDLMRDAHAAALGFVTLRFDYAMVVYEWPTVLAAILANIDAGHHRSPAGMRLAADC